MVCIKPTPTLVWVHGPGTVSVNYIKIPCLFLVPWCQIWSFHPRTHTLNGSFFLKPFHLMVYLTRSLYIRILRRLRTQWVWWTTAFSQAWPLVGVGVGVGVVELHKIPFICLFIYLFMSFYPPPGAKSGLSISITYTTYTTGPSKTLTL